MKKKEILYSAMSGISEDKAADAYEYRNYNRNKTVLKNVLYGAGIAAIFCSFIVASLILQSVSKAPEQNVAASSGSVVTDEIKTEEITAETEEQTEAAVETAMETTSNTSVIAESTEEKRYTNSGAVAADYPTIEELYQTESYKDFLPAYIPDELVYQWAIRSIPGEYLQDDGSYYKNIEKIIMHFSTVKGSNSENALSIMMSHESKRAWPSADEISVSCIEYGKYSAGADPEPGIAYTLSFTADGWEISYQYKHLCSEEELITPQDLIDIITSAPYFKDHPLETDVER